MASLSMQMQILMNHNCGFHMTDGFKCGLKKYLFFSLIPVKELKVFQFKGLRFSSRADFILFRFDIKGLNYYIILLGSLYIIYVTLTLAIILLLCPVQ